MVKTRIIIAFDIHYTSFMLWPTNKLVAAYFDGESTESIYLEFTTLIAPPTV